MDIHFGGFVWDSDKAAKNLEKHGVDFTEAVEAFLDPRRGIFFDAKHSRDEERFFCIGRAGRGVLTVRFTRREGRLRILGAGYWRKGRAEYEKSQGS